MTPAVSSFHSAKAERCDRCRRAAARAFQDDRGGGTSLLGCWASLPQVAVIGFGSPVLQLCFQSRGEFANEG